MLVKKIKFGSKDYYDLLEFRYINLRKPLNINWSSDDLKNENEQIHFALKKKNIIIGSCILKQLGKKECCIRQMAISTEFQNNGYGKKLLRYAENYAFKQNIIKINIKARMSAVGFYLKEGYKKEGKIFIDVTVKSVKMIKFLDK